MRFEAVPGSPLPEVLRAHGYIVNRIGTTERIVPFVYTVLAGYAAGPPFGGQQVSAVQQSGQAHVITTSAALR